MKKWISLWLVVALCLSFTACMDLSFGDSDDEVTELQVGEQVISEKCEFTVEHIVMTKTVEPPVKYTTGYYQYTAGSENIYVDVCVAYKNTDNDSVFADDAVDGRLMCDNSKYYDLILMEISNRSNFANGDSAKISPLMTEYIHCLFEVPYTAAQSSEEIVLKLTVDDLDYEIVVRDGGNSGGVTQKNNIEVGMTVASEKSQCYIISAGFSQKVTPHRVSLMDDQYAYYEASENNIFVDVCLEYKNIGTQTVKAEDVISAELKYAKKYRYEGACIIEDLYHTGFVHTYDVTPSGLPAYIHYVFEVPKEVKTSGESVVIEISFDNHKYWLQIQ